MSCIMGTVNAIGSNRPWWWGVTVNHDVLGSIPRLSAKLKEVVDNV